MRYGILLLLVLPVSMLVLSGCGQRTYGELLSKRAKVSSYQGALNAPTRQKPMTMLVLMKNGKMSKMKSEMPNGFMLMDFEKKNMYIGDTTKHTAMLMPMDKTGSYDLADMDFTNMLAAGLTEKSVSKKSEKVNGVKCWVFEPAEGSKGLVERLYIDDKYGLVRKAAGMPNSPPDPSAKGNAEVKKEEVTFSYDRINQVKDSEFALPADMKVTSMEDAMKDMMKGMSTNPPSSVR